MTDATETSSTRPYLIRALYEWCTDNCFTPYVAVIVDDSVQVPREYVKDGQIVLNLSFEATSSLKLGNDFIEFRARFAGTAREIMVPVKQVSAIYARENGQGMAFPLTPAQGGGGAPVAAPAATLLAVPNSGHVAEAELRPAALTSVESERPKDASNAEPEPPRPPTTGPRPTLKRVK